MGTLYLHAGDMISTEPTLERVGMAFTMVLAAYNLIRIPKLLAQA